MPLSEQEQRLLEEMERSLYHNDADYVAGGAGRHGKPTYTRIVLGVLVGIVGVATLIGGVALRLPIVGVIGFVLMFLGVLIALTPPRHSRPSDASEAGSSPRADSTNGKQSGGKSFLQNLGERWENRTDERDE